MICNPSKCKELVVRKKNNNTHYEQICKIPQCNHSSLLGVTLKVTEVTAISVNIRGGSRIFFRRGCTRLLLYFNTNKPHSFFFFCRIPDVLENRRSSQGGCTPCTLHPPHRSASEHVRLKLVKANRCLHVLRSLRRE